MMSLASGMGSVVTFYSWKGGVGRTLALANTAVQLARAGRKVLMIDWDLEAPGLHHYFLTSGKPESQHLHVTPAKSSGGLWSLLHSASTRANGDLDPEEWESAVIRITVPPAEPGVRSPYVPTPAPLDLLPTGHDRENYSEELGDFSWSAFFRDSRGGEWLETARRQWVQNYDFIFIDSRTGLTDSGGVCTIQLPDTLVLVFAANDQSFSGGMKIAAAAQKARRDYGYDRGQLTIIPLLSRWSGGEEIEIAEQWMRRFDQELRPVTGPWLPKSFTPRRFVERLRVPHVARFSFGEPLPVLTHSLTDPALPGFAFDSLARLIASDMADVAKIIDPAYDPPKFPTDRNVSNENRWSMLAMDLVALHRELGEIARINGPDSGELSFALSAAGEALFRRARFEEAEPLMRRALAIDEKRLASDHPNVATGLNNLAQLLQAINRLAEAEPLMRRALAIGEASLGPAHPNVAASLNNLAGLLLETNRLAEAEPLMRRALAIGEASLGPAHPNVAASLNNLAGLLQATNRLAEAEPLMRRALAIGEASLGPDHPHVATSLSNLAALLQAINRLGEAEPLMRRALAIDEASLGPDHPEVAIDLNNLAGLLQDTNRLGEAEPLMRRALAIDEASFGPDHPNVARDLNNLARLLRATSRLTEAEPLMRHMTVIFLTFQRTTGHKHPHADTNIHNYEVLLSEMGWNASAIRTAIESARREAGLTPESGSIAPRMGHHTAL